MLMLLAVRATDATTIRAVGGFLFGLTLFFFVMMGLASWMTSFSPASSTTPRSTS